MKSKVSFAFVILPTLLLLCLVLWRKETIGGKVYRDGLSADGVIKISGGVVHKVKAVWGNRDFSNIEDSRASIAASVSQFPMSEKARIEASASCWKILKSYSSGDWGMFRSVRIPVPGYKFVPEIATALLKHAPDAGVTNLVDIYGAIWRKNFETNGLFAEVSLSSNSISLLKVQFISVDQISFPAINETAGLSWVEANPACVFDYRNIISQNSGQIQALRFFFYGKLGEEVSPYMITFVWDDVDAAWLPWRMSIGIAGKPVHHIAVF